MRLLLSAMGFLLAALSLFGILNAVLFRIHGPGADLGLVAGTLAVLAFLAARSLKEDTHDALCYEDAVPLLLREFPEISDAYAKEREWWGDEEPGATIIYEDLFGPEFERIVVSGTESDADRVFGFLERLAEAEDARMQDLLAVTVLKRVTELEPEVARHAKRHMRRATRRLMKVVEAG